MLSQLGLSVITPPLICIFATLWIREKFGLGNWIVVAGIIFGTLSGVVSLVNYLKTALKDAQKSQKEYQDRFK